MSKVELKWIEIFLSIVILISGIITFSFNTFATKDGIKDSVIDRLDRIESKLDRLIEVNHR
jgi:hypothetical protein